MEDPSESKILPFIRAFYNTDNVVRRLEYCHAISTSLDDKTMKIVEKKVKDVKGIKKDIEDLLENTSLMRQFRFRYSMTESSEAVLYFGRDFEGDDTYTFLAGIEKDISRINVFLLKFVNFVLKELKFEEDISLNY